MIKKFDPFNTIIEYTTENFIFRDLKNKSFQ